MTQHTLECNGVEIEAILEETHSFGDSWFESLAVGLRRMAPVVLMGLYDDTATTGPDVVYNSFPAGPSSATRTFTCLYGAAKSTSCETLLQKYKRMLSRGVLHKYETTLQPTGVVTEA
jgi:hypothetical protein